jgi:hypothetical protein
MLIKIPIFLHFYFPIFLSERKASVQKEKIINVPVPPDLFRKLYQRRLDTGIPVCRIVEGILKFGSYFLDDLDKETSWQISEDAATLLYGKLFRDKLAKRGFHVHELDVIISKAEAFLEEKWRKKENEDRSNA